MDATNIMDEMVYNYSLSLCVLYSPEIKAKKKRMSEEDYKKAMEELKNIENELQRRKLLVSKGL